MKTKWITALVLPAAVMVVLGMTSMAASASGPAARTTLIGKSVSARTSSPPNVRYGQPVQHLRVEHSFGVKAIPDETSSNWSGYADTGHSAANGDFSNIAANWNVPEIPDSACPSGDYGYRLAAMWVGLDGDGSGTVEQDGTTSQCHNGTLSYYSWYEMYPDGPVREFNVSPGDHMSAYVDYTGSYWLLTLIDNSDTSDSFVVIASCPSGATCDNYSAEAIAEAPSGCSASSSQVCRGTEYPLADYDYAVFSDVSVAMDLVGGGIGTTKFHPAAITMVDSSDTALSEVTKPIKKDGFTVSWEAST
jgi:hypothetical protein